MAISAHDATILWKQNRDDAGVAMQEVLQYSLSLNTSLVRWFRERQYLSSLGQPLGRIEMTALANNAIAQSDYGRYRFLTITHGSTRTFNGWVRIDNVGVDGTRNDVLRYKFDIRVIWIVP
jgi:hypothetical protein